MNTKKFKMFKERPECVIKGCKEPALIICNNMLICGDCMLKFYESQQKKQTENMMEVCGK